VKLALRHPFDLDASPPSLAGFLAHLVGNLPDVEGPADDVLTYEAHLHGSGDIATSSPQLPEHTTAPTPAIARLLTTINVAAVASMDEVPVLHASCAAVDGTAIVVPGHPGAGKSTLVAGLVAEGCTYLTDEAVPLDASAAAVPYPKPIVVGRGSWPALAHAEHGRVTLEGVALDAWHLDPVLLGSTAAVDPAPVGLVVVPRYVPGSETLIEPLSPAEATAAMSSNTFNLRRHGRAAVERCALVAREARAVRVTHSDLREVARRLMDLAAP
jgi:hypothetical protein